MTILNFKFLRNFYARLTPQQFAFVDFVLDVIVIVLVVLLLIKPFLFAPFRVQQESMMPNVRDGEYIITWKLPYHDLLGWREYARNDIVVFQAANNAKHYLIKRIIGLPGETLRIHAGQVWIKAQGAEDFVALEEDFLYSKSETCLATNFCSQADKERKNDFVIPAGEYFVLGDNRNRSRDSRSCFQGVCQTDADHFLDHKEIDGKVILTFGRYLKNNEPFYKFWGKISFRDVRSF